MKKKFLFLLLISGLSFSQQKNLKITDLQPRSEDFAFPKVSYAEKPLVENKINTFLQVNQLEYIPGSVGSPSNQWIFRALVEADLQGNKISGTWQDHKTKKYLKLELEEL